VASVILIPTQVNLGIKGFFRFQTRDKFSGKITSDTGWFPNTILDAGRDAMGSRNDWMTYCQVGTDGTFPPTLAGRQAETSLGNHYAGTNTLVSGSVSNGQSGVAPYYGWKRKTWRFDAGTVATNLSEAAVGWGASGSTIITRAPILDPVLLTPTTVTPLANELLDVSYELRYYSPIEDVIGPQVTLDGVVYNTITRASAVTGDQWSNFIGSQIGHQVSDEADWSAFDGDIGTILTGPSGTSDGCGNTSQSSNVYANNSYERIMTCYAGAAGWNPPSLLGIRSIRIRTTAGEYQTSFHAVGTLARIPKDVNYQMTMLWTISWEEYIAPWVAGTYALGDRVTHIGLKWESDINNNTSEPGVADWTQI
jgi:hypothetical protein